MADKQNVENLGEAISVLVQAVNIAQAKGGVYTFADAAKINSALTFIEEVTKSEGPKSSTPVVEIDETVEK
jgi:hypothetical protein